MTTTVSGTGSAATTTAPATSTTAADKIRRRVTINSAPSRLSGERSLRRLGGLLRQHDDPRPGLVAEIHLFAVGRRGHGDILAPAFELCRADQRNKLALRVE